MKKVKIIVIEYEKKNNRKSKRIQIEQMLFCSYFKIPWNEIYKYHIAILEYISSEKIAEMINTILRLKCMNGELLISVINKDIPVQEQMILLRAGIDTFITESENEEELKMRLEELENILWYKNWKKKK